MPAASCYLGSAQTSAGSFVMGEKLKPELMDDEAPRIAMVHYREDFASFSIRRRIHFSSCSRELSGTSTNLSPARPRPSAQAISPLGSIEIFVSGNVKRTLEIAPLGSTPSK